jgi:exodeoxyribonuclease VII large subunit
MSRRPSDDRCPAPDAALRVSAITEQIKQALETRFADVWVVGEISGLTRAASGHLYLSLKDEDSVLRGVVWRTAIPQLAIDPTDGLEVICHGRLDVYAARGTYQLTIDRMHAVGTGGLEARLREVAARLESEGLFAQERKRPLPRFPRRIALVTSPAGAALSDFLQTLRGRWQACEIVLVPARVQGAGAAEELAAAIRTACTLRPSVDVVAVVRGGGSLEDLWAFNEEVLVRAVAAARVPVISGVGHEIDVSLVDLAADARGLTPTDAAVQIAPDRRELAAHVGNTAMRLVQALTRRTAMARERLEQFARRRAFIDPWQPSRERRRLLAGETARLQRLMQAAVERARERLAAAADRLEADSPLSLLARGYSVTCRADTNAPLRDVRDVKPGDHLITQIATGQLHSTVHRITADAFPTAAGSGVSVLEKAETLVGPGAGMR